MYGDIILVERRPTLFHSTKLRENPQSKWVDKLIFRTVPYRHFGIEVENGQVIHFSADNFFSRKTSIIKKVPMSQFLLDGEKRVLHLGKTRLSREETVFRAYSMIGTTEKDYSISNNNCEHFAFWCATGEYHSDQVWWISKGQYILLLPTRVIPFTVRTKNRTVKLSMHLYDRLLRRA